MRGATSPRLLLELMCAQVLLPAAATDERSLLARLERLEAGAPVAASTAPAPVRPPAGDADPYLRTGAAGSPDPAPSPDGRAARDAARPASSRGRLTRPAPEGQSPPGSAGTAVAWRATASPVAVRARARARRRAGAVAPRGGTRRAAASRTRLYARPRGRVPARRAGPAPAPGGAVTVDVLRQAWPSLVEAIKSKGRVAAIVVGNASVASFDEGVLTLRFPRQGDVKGFQGSKYEDLLSRRSARCSALTS